jgi:ribosomal 30S subunit maturation factor RimM
MKEPKEMTISELELAQEAILTEMTAKKQERDAVRFKPLEQIDTERIIRCVLKQVSTDLDEKAESDNEYFVEDIMNAVLGDDYYDRLHQAKK